MAGRQRKNEEIENPAFLNTLDYKNQLLAVLQMRIFRLFQKKDRRFKSRK